MLTYETSATSYGSYGDREPCPNRPLSHRRPAAVACLRGCYDVFECEKGDVVRTISMGAQGFEELRINECFYVDKLPRRVYVYRRCTH